MENLTGTPITLELRNPQQPLSQMNLQSETKTFTIDTRYREQYYKKDVEDFIYNLPEPLENVVNLNVSSIQIPGTIYNIDAFYNNNYFHYYDPSGYSIPGHTVAGPGLRKFVVVNGNYSYPSSSDSSITDPTGFYVRTTDNAGEIVAGVNNAIEYDINTNKPILKTTNGGYVTFSSVFTSNNMRIPFSLNIFTYRSRFAFQGSGSTGENRIYFNLKKDATTTPDVDPSVVDPTPLQLKLGWILGYRFGEYDDSTAVAESRKANRFISEGVYDPQYPRYFYILVDDYNKNYNSSFVSYFNKSTLDGNVIARVPIDISYKESNGPMMFTYALSSPRIYHGPVKISKLRIKLLDPYGRTMNFNNMDYTINFQVTSMLSN